MVLRVVSWRRTFNVAWTKSGNQCGRVTNCRESNGFDWKICRVKSKQTRQPSRLQKSAGTKREPLIFRAFTPCWCALISCGARSNGNNSRNRIFFNRVAVLIRPPGFLQLPRTVFGRPASFVMTDGRIAVFLKTKHDRFKPGAGAAFKINQSLIIF